MLALVNLSAVSDSADPAALTPVVFDGAVLQWFVSYLNHQT